MKDSVVTYKKYHFLLKMLQRQALVSWKAAVELGALQWGAALLLRCAALPQARFQRLPAGNLINPSLLGQVLHELRQHTQELHVLE